MILLYYRIKHFNTSVNKRRIASCGLRIESKDNPWSAISNQDNLAINQFTGLPIKSYIAYRIKYSVEDSNK